MDEAILRRVASINCYLSLTNDLDRFDYVTELALTRPSLPKEACIEANRILACDSRLWARLSATSRGIDLLLESDSLLVKGLGLLLADAVALPVANLAKTPIGLSDLLYERQLISTQRKRGLAELEARVLAFAGKCQ